MERGLDVSARARVELIRLSGMFDENWYQSYGAPSKRGSAIEHYVTTGWKLGNEPNPDFTGKEFLPYFRSAGLEGPPLATWLMLRAANWPVYARLADVQAIAAVVRQSGLLDEAAYSRLAGISTAELDAAEHYVLLGDSLRIAPSAFFNPAYYAARNLDVSAQPINLLVHFYKYGSIEGRRGLPRGATEPVSGERYEAGRKNVLLVVHDASRTGAPILGWNVGRRLAEHYNIYTVQIGGGELAADFADMSTEVHGPFIDRDKNDSEIDFSLRPLLERRTFEYAIVNSLESRWLVKILGRRFIPTILLVHEFSAYYLPGELHDAFDLASEIVFPAKIVVESYRTSYPVLALRPLRFYPQGPSELPAPRKESGLAVRTRADPVRQAHDPRTGKRLLPADVAAAKARGAFLVLGAGTVHIRKGVDLFIGVAASAWRIPGRRRVHFLWVGHGYRPAQDMGYSAYLAEQVRRSGVSGSLTFIDETDDLESLYEASDAFLLTSRLDPLPNVTIDAAIRGKPIICFRDASGIAEILDSTPETAGLVLPHLDVEGAARAVRRVADDADFYDAVSAQTKAIAERTFDMDKYVERLDQLGRSLSTVTEQQRLDVELIDADPTFDQYFNLRRYDPVETRLDSIRRYVVSSTARRGQRVARADAALRRPAPGFNAFLYRAQTIYPLGQHENAFAGFLRAGKPPGPWQLPVLGGSANVAGDIRASLRVCLHAHFYYPELVADFARRLSRNLHPVDVFVSTNAESKAELLRRGLADYTNGEVIVRVVPNRGRDILPLLNTFAEDVQRYDVVGHIHGKRSIELDDSIGDTWRVFLWDNLLGVEEERMIDAVVDAFERNRDIGLIYPDDPSMDFVGWGKNRRVARKLLARLGFTNELPELIDFPIGTMFWSRIEALRPLLDLGLRESECPAEPVPYDGTVLHAIERIIPIVCRMRGYRSMVSNILGTSR